MMIKICGITNLDDARAAVESGATALGFNFFPASPRFVTVEDAGRVIASLPAAVCKVGVFVNMAPEQVAETARELALDVAQLHGDETAAQFPHGMRVWKAVRVDAEFRPEALDAYPAEAVLLDSGGGGLYGGSGQTFDWSRAAGSKCKIVWPAAWTRTMSRGRSSKPGRGAWMPVRALKPLPAKRTTPEWPRF